MAAMIPQKFDSQQLESIIGRVVPLVAEPEDHNYFRGVLYAKADSCESSAEFAAFIAKLLASNNA